MADGPSQFIVLSIMKLAYGKRQIDFPSELKNFLERYTLNINEFFSEFVIAALDLFMSQIHNGKSCLKVSHKEHLESIKNSPDKVLEYFGHYSMKHTFNPRGNRTGYDFFSVGSDFFNEMVKSNNLKDYCNKLNKVARQILARDNDVKEARQILVQDFNKAPVSITSTDFRFFLAYEKKFVQDICNYLLPLYNMPADMKLNITEKFYKKNVKIPDLFSHNIESALGHAKSHHDSICRSKLREYGNEYIYDYFREKCYVSENNQNILHIAVTAFRKYVKEKKIQQGEHPIIQYFNHLIEILTHAKKEGRYINLLEMDEAAQEMNAMYDDADSEIRSEIEKGILKNLKTVIEAEEIRLRRIAEYEAASLLKKSNN